jgi:YD repeat-containing protein
MRQLILCGCAIAALAASTAASASETIAYTYDARGRLKIVLRSGGVNGTKTTTYTLDKADNRTVKTTT